MAWSPQRAIPTDYYALMIDGEQRYAITRRTPQGAQAIRDWTFSPSLNKGQAVNRLARGAARK